MRTLTKYALPLLLALSASACSKKDQPQPDVNPPNEAAQPASPDATAQAAQEPQPEAPKNENTAPEPEAPQKEQAQAPTDAEAMQKLRTLPAEAMENELLKAFDTADQADDALKTLRERSDLGDDRAKEQFVKTVFSRPRTDPNYNAAVKYMTSIREYKDPDVMYQRAVYEYSRRITDPEAGARAIQFFKMATDLDHEPTLRFLIQNPSLGLVGTALQKITELYKKKPQTPENLFDLAKLLEMGPSELMPQVETLITAASDAGYPKAMFVRSGQLMDRDDSWLSGFELLQKAAAAGSEDANLRLAIFYIAIAFSDSREEASEFAAMPLSEIQYNAIKNIVDKASDKKLFCVETLKKSSGLEESCRMLLGFAAETAQTPSKLEAASASVACLKDFIDAMPTRDACDHAYDLATYAWEEEITEADLAQIFTEPQRTRLGQILTSCYQTALANGDDYPAERPYIGYSTAFQLAVLHTGNSTLNIPQKTAERLKYHVYAAHHNDLAAQVTLAMNYEHGGDFSKNPERACFWYAMADNHHVCRLFCPAHLNDEDFSDTCKFCTTAKSSLIKCTKPANP